MLDYKAFSQQPIRWPTRVVMVGDVAVGGTHPIRIQSMTTSDTRDVAATVEQIQRLADYGCEIARITVQGMKEAEACEAIKSQLIQTGYTIPLVADIHFYPPAALRVVDYVDKVRINPGNYADKRASFREIVYDDASYASELIRIEEKFAPLVLKCKELKRAMRIGANHGSLSDRIMNRYGDTPRGMVESALEFARICRSYDYHDFIFSMKASNPLVMIHAYRLLVASMQGLGWNYPLHLGVTEAGEGEDGRIKSSVGIGALLLDGIGDTLRVSLTEDALHEIDPCRRLVNLAEKYVSLSSASTFAFHDTFAVEPRAIAWPSDQSFHRDGTVALKVTAEQLLDADFYTSIGCDTAFGRPKLRRDSVDLLLLDNSSSHTESALQQRLLHLHEAGITVIKRYAFVSGEEDDLQWEALQHEQPSCLLVKPRGDNRIQAVRQLFTRLRAEGWQVPVLLCFNYSCAEADLLIHAAAECGMLLCDGMGEGILLEGPYPLAVLRRLSFNILQACRRRMFKTEFISCPSCGRTLFNLQEVSARIRSRTAHLPGVKIAIMGCIVNGPGEMADADFGYVGSRPGKIDLYVGKNCVEKNIDFSDADDRLVALIKEHGRWMEPEAFVLSQQLGGP
jgi:(E)-4-hydroxy-3-methylbut-2-enyl-diphosphate synthase